MADRYQRCFVPPCIARSPPRWRTNRVPAGHSCQGAVPGPDGVNTCCPCPRDRRYPSSETASSLEATQTTISECDTSCPHPPQIAQIPPCAIFPCGHPESHLVSTGPPSPPVPPSIAQGPPSQPVPPSRAIALTVTPVPCSRSPPVPPTIARGPPSPPVPSSRGGVIRTVEQTAPCKALIEDQTATSQETSCTKSVCETYTPDQYQMCTRICYPDSPPHGNDKIGRPLSPEQIPRTPDQSRSRNIRFGVTSSPQPCYCSEPNACVKTPESPFSPQAASSLRRTLVNRRLFTDSSNSRTPSSRSRGYDTSQRTPPVLHTSLSDRTEAIMQRVDWIARQLQELDSSMRRNICSASDPMAVLQNVSALSAMVHQHRAGVEEVRRLLTMLNDRMSRRDDMRYSNAPTTSSYQSYVQDPNRRSPSPRREIPRSTQGEVSDVLAAVENLEDMFARTENDFIMYGAELSSRERSATSGRSDLGEVADMDAFSLVSSTLDDISFDLFNVSNSSSKK